MPVKYFYCFNCMDIKFKLTLNCSTLHFRMEDLLFGFYLLFVLCSTCSDLLDESVLVNRCD